LGTAPIALLLCVTEDYCIRNREPRKQAGEIIETRTPILSPILYQRHLQQRTTQDEGRQAVRQSDINPSKADVQPWMDRLMEAVSAGKGFPSGTQLSLSDFIEKHYLLRHEKEKSVSVSTANGYKRTWDCYWEFHIGNPPLTDLRTALAAAVLDHHAKNRLGRNTLSR